MLVSSGVLEEDVGYGEVLLREKRDMKDKTDRGRERVWRQERNRVCACERQSLPLKGKRGRNTQVERDALCCYRFIR